MTSECPPALSCSQTQYKKLLNSFRLSIRRKQLDTLFQTHRNLHLKLQAQQNVSQLRSTLSLATTQAREEWLHGEALKLTGFPSEAWHAVMGRLYSVLTLYEGEFGNWVGFGVVGALGDCFREEYWGVGLGKLAANMLSDIFWLCSKNQEHKVIKNMLQLKFADSVIVLLNENPQTEYIRLLAIVCEVAPIMRNYLIGLGLLQFLVRKMGAIGKNQDKTGGLVDRNSQNFYTILYLMYALVKTHQIDSETFQKPKKSTILTLLPLLSHQLSSNSTPKTLTLLLRSLKQLCLVQKTQIFTQLSTYTTIFTKSMELLCYEENWEVRLASVRFLSNFLLSDDVGHTRFLVEMAVVDRVYESYRLVGNRQENRYGLMSFLVNFTADHKEFQDLIIAHPILTQILIPESTSHSPQLRQQSVYCLCNLLRQCPPSQLPLLLSHLQLENTLVTNLTRNDRNVETVREVLTCFREICRGDEEMGKMLLRGYGVKGILEGIQNGDEEVEEEIGDFLCFLEEFERD